MLTSVLASSCFSGDVYGLLGNTGLTGNIPS